MIPEVTATVNDILESAVATPSVKRFVMTSSSTAATNPKPGVKFTIEDTTWNQEAIDAAWAPPPYNAGRRWDVYGASKTQAEQELWKFIREHKSISLVANTVLPNGNFGPFLSSEHQASGGSTATWISNLYKDGLTYQKDIPPRKLATWPLPYLLSRFTDLLFMILANHMQSILLMYVTMLVFTSLL